MTLKPKQIPCWEVPQQTFCTCSNLHVYVDGQYFCRTANPAFLAAFGRAKGEVQGRLLSEIIGGPLFEEVFAPALEDAVYGVFREVSAWMQLPLRGRRYVGIRCTPSFAEVGGLRGIVIEMSDRTEEKLVEMREQTHRNELMHLARLSTMGEMTAGLVHELSQPLAAITSYAQGLAEQLRAGAMLPPAHAVKVLDKVAALSGQAAALGHNIRKLSSPQPIEWEQVDFNEMVQDTLELVSAPLKKDGIATRVELTPELPKIEGSSVLLRQVLLNLVLNAIQAMGDTARAERNLLLHTSRGGSDCIALMVQDTGGGLDPAVAPHLFEPFVTTKRDGLGLGLSISHRIVSMHGGRLWASQNPVRGATFHMTLPLQRCHQQREQNGSVLPTGW